MSDRTLSPLVMQWAKQLEPGGFYYIGVANLTHAQARHIAYTLDRAVAHLKPPVRFIVGPSEAEIRKMSIGELSARAEELRDGGHLWAMPR